MDGIWFAAMVACFIVAGVAAQLGWQWPSMPAVKRVIRRRRPRLVEPGEPLAPAPPSAAV
jgi:hypothetical protein